MSKALNLARYGNSDPGRAYGKSFTFDANANITDDMDGGTVVVEGSGAVVTLTSMPAVADRSYAVSNRSDYAAILVTYSGDFFDTGSTSIVVYPGQFVVITAEVTGFLTVSISIGEPGTPVNAARFGLLGDNDTDNNTALASAFEAVPSVGGVLDIPPAPDYYALGGTIELLDRCGIVVDGHGTGAHNTNTGGQGAPSLIVSTAGRASGEPLFRLSYSAAVTQQNKGNLTFRGVSSALGAIGDNGYHYHIRKTAAYADFFGDFSWVESLISGGEIGIYLDGTGGGNTGYGWIRLDRARIQGVATGIYSGINVNIMSITESTVRWCTQAAAGSYVSDAGGGLRLPGGTALTIADSNLEGQRIALIAFDWSAVTITGNYAEAMNDGFVALRACSNVLIANNYQADNVSRQTYIKLCRDLKHFGNGSATGRGYLVCDIFNRDIETDTPELTRYTVQETGSTTLQPVDFGFQIHSIPMRQKAFRPPLSAHVMMSGTTVTNATAAASAELGPRGEVGKCLQITATSDYGRIELEYTGVTMVPGKFIVITVDVKLDSGNTGNADGYFYWEVREKIGAGATTLVHSGTTPSYIVSRGEWVTYQWVHKCESTDNYEGKIRLSPTVTGDVLHVGGSSLVIVDSPAVDPMRGFFGDDDVYFLSCGDGRYWQDGTAAPADAKLAWQDGEQIYTTAAASGASPGLSVTTPGTGGGTAVFKAMAVLA